RPSSHCAARLPDTRTLAQQAVPSASRRKRPNLGGLAENCLLGESGRLVEARTRGGSAGEGGVGLVGGRRLAGDRDVRRGQQEDLVGDPLDLAVEALRQAAREVDEAPG